MMISNKILFELIIIFFVSINILAFFIMLLDKIKAEKGRSERISEGVLFFMASAFGSLGVYAGMFALRHKTRKWYFLLGVPLLILENGVFLYMFYTFLK